MAATSGIALAAAALSGQAPPAEPLSLAALLRRPHVHYPLLAAHGCAPPAGSAAALAGPAEEEAAETEAKYAPFIERQARQAASTAARSQRPLPDGLDYGAIATIGSEGREKLAKFRPATLGAAGRIGGVSPADITALLVHLEGARRREARAAAAEEEGGEEGGGAGGRRGGGGGTAAAAGRRGAAAEVLQGGAAAAR